MKFLVVGLGSMGKRRIRNLQYLGEQDVIGFDMLDDRRKECEEKYHITTFNNIDKAMTEKPDALVISTPPNHHLEYELLAAKNNKHFFCEAGVFSKGVDELIKICKTKKIVAAPSATLRFNDSIKKIKKLIDEKKIGTVVAVTYHMGQYLPDWHPWENISKFYVGQRETSATREMVPFEMEWLTWIFGDVEKLSCIKGKISALPVDIDDVYQLIFQFKSGVIGHLLIEVISRTPTRILRIVGEKGSIEWNWMDDVVKMYDPEKKKWIEFKEEKGFKEKGYVAKENMYIEEIRNFVQAIHGERSYIYSLEQDYQILSLLKAAETSSNKGKHIDIK
jgi:predicted dehydrogenase